MSQVLIIFVDSLPADRLLEMEHLAAWDAWPLTPGFGYSINLHPELFAGLTPDEVGFFCEWTYDPVNAPGRPLRPILPALSAICRPYVLNRGVQSIITSRKYPDKRINIPLRHIDKFSARDGRMTSDTFPAPTIFSRHRQLAVLSARGRPKGRRDHTLFDEARQLIDRGSQQLFVPLPDLDGIGHDRGLDSPQYRTHLQRLDTWIDTLARRFLGCYPDGDVFVVSDHGMAPVQRGVRFDIEERLGLAGEDRYVYFTDSTLLRVWVRQPALVDSVREYLHEFGHGRVVSPEERQRFGLTTPAFGDIIFVLDEGLAFKPSYFARNIPKAMHGYRPDTVSQTALLAHRGAHAPPGKLWRSTDAFRTLDTTLSS